jgi:hypothetical protein
MVVAGDEKQPRVNEKERMMRKYSERKKAR